MPLIQTRGLRFAYGRDRWAIDGVTLEIHLGERLALLGPNGAGKSTLMQLLVGLIAPCEGEIWLDGVPVSNNKAGRRQLRCRAGLVLQDPDDQIFSDTVESDVIFGPLNAGDSPEVARQKAREAIWQMGIEPLAQRRVTTLSLGEKKRVALAGMLAMRPALLLLDEPTAGLDDSGQQALLGALQSLERCGVSVVIATHDTALALEWAARAVVIESGRVAAEGPPALILRDSELCRRAGLRQPLLCQLAGLLNNHSRQGMPQSGFANADEFARWFQSIVGPPEGVCR